jgi:membrane associated rhomboid family serine protease
VIPLKDENPTQRAPIVTIAIILACVGIYFLWQPSPFGDTPADAKFTFEQAAIPCEVLHGRPLSIDELTATYNQGNSTACGVTGSQPQPGFPNKDVWLSVLVSIFLHGSIIHLAGNMLFFWVFGNNVNDRLGNLKFALFYLVGGLMAAGTHFALNPSSTVPVVGASGAIAAVMGAYLVWWPDAPVRTIVIFFFIFVPRIRAKWLLIFWFISQFFTDPNSGTAWAAHVGGFVFGALVAMLIRNNRAAQRVAFRSSQRPVGAWDNTGGAGYQWFDDQRRFGGRR